jgi:hypothetical protein
VKRRERQKSYEEALNTLKENLAVPSTKKQRRHLYCDDGRVFA